MFCGHLLCLDVSILSFNPCQRIYLLILEREEGGQREREKHRCERETLISCLLYASQLGTEPTA